MPQLILFLSLFSSVLVTVHSAFIFPIQKDHTTHQYTTRLYLKTPLQPIKLVVDLGGSFTWVDCYQNYNSSTYQHVPCGTPLCDSFLSRACGNCFQPPGPACANDTCEFFPENSVTRQVNLEAAIIDSLALPTTSHDLGHLEKYIFSCARTSLLQGLAKGVSGIVAMGRSNISLQAQVIASFSSPRYFSLCLSGSRKVPGVGFIGSSGPYNFSPGIDISRSLIYTPLVVNPVGGTVISYSHPSDEYFIGLTSIRVNSNIVPLNQTLLAIYNETGFGGTKISTVVPYTTFQSSIYKAITDCFVKESSAMNLTLTKPAKPFSFCYEAKDMVRENQVGPSVPVIDLALGSETSYWRIYGSNSMVRVESKGVDVWCLGFMDGGENPRTSIVIGGYQMEDNLLQFDLESNRLGFSSSLLLKGTSCSDFNFTIDS